MAGAVPTTTRNPSPSRAQGDYTMPLVVLTSLFFMWGFITALNDILIPHLRAVFTLSYVQAMLIQFCFFAAYLIVSFPAGYVVEKLGYKRGIIVGLVVAGLGCLLFYPAAGRASYALFLGALFILASGITLLQVAANPYVTVLGRPETASARLNLTQAFNSLGTTLAPFFGSMLILAVAARPVADAATLSPAERAAQAAAEASAVQGPYIGLAVVLFLIAVVIALSRLPAIEAAEQPAELPPDTAQAVYHTHDSVWQYRHLVLGALGIFVYVGAEVSIGSFLVNFMADPGVAGLPEETAAKYLSLYWGGAMVGRFIGAALLKKVRPGHLLAFNALVVVGLLVLAMLVSGKAAMWAMLAIGLFNSIMFPTIFSLAIEGLGKHTGEGSGVVCMAIVGGAIVPVIMGFFADRIGLLHAFFVPALCYLYIAYYGLKGHYADFEPVAARRQG
ncbi:L-fucose:H+ symporter permease [Azohydromonas caseinilytica]|uniref:L-fucose:H+ symporter permease n=1 Tax=Azohydromonas caseinilytica TaxID=2728836 RepID=A0A848FCC0_9BURK|nr:L-fucose:H+ symporter permease [Azohydromonas caseinilytica]NML16059.1 L-fucose:H+ symporter permease [Azohydromonas caseinilytica]